jgi:hypothetical protein
VSDWTNSAMWRTVAGSCPTRRAIGQSFRFLLLIEVYIIDLRLSDSWMSLLCLSHTN